MLWTRQGRRGVAAVAAALTLTLLPGAAPASAVTRHGAARPATGANDWDMWGYDLQRTGFNPNETTLDPSAVPGLHLDWQFPYATTSYNAPVFASGVDVDGTPTDLVYAGDNSGEFYAVNAATGALVWSQDLGVNDSVCFGDLGVSSTATIDRATNRIYAIGGGGALYAMDLADGTIASGWPVQVTQFPNEYVWDAVAENDGELYLGVASTCDRGGTYYGRVARVNASTAAVDGNFYVTDGPDTGVSGGGIWGWGGVSVDPATGDVFEASGNGYPNDQYEHFEYAESVVRLTKDLSVLSSDYPGLTGKDVDFGSTPILFTAKKACGQQLFVMNKDGEVLLYDADDIASGPVEALQTSAREIIGVAAYSPTDHRIYYGNPSNSPDKSYRRGLLSFRIGSDCKLKPTWSYKVKGRGLTTSPVSADGVVYWGDSVGNELYAFDQATHKLIWSSGSLFTDSPRTEPIVVGGHLYITVGSSLYAFGP